MASPRSTTRRRRGSDIVKEMKIRLTVLRERVTPDMVDQYVGIGTWLGDWWCPGSSGSHAHRRVWCLRNRWKP